MMVWDCDSQQEDIHGSNHFVMPLGSYSQKPTNSLALADGEAVEGQKYITKISLISDILAYHGMAFTDVWFLMIHDTDAFDDLKYTYIHMITLKCDIDVIH